MTQLEAITLIRNVLTRTTFHSKTKLVEKVTDFFKSLKNKDNSMQIQGKIISTYPFLQFKFIFFADQNVLNDVRKSQEKIMVCLHFSLSLESCG